MGEGAEKDMGTILRKWKWTFIDLNPLKRLKWKSKDCGEGSSLWEEDEEQKTRQTTNKPQNPSFIDLFQERECCVKLTSRQNSSLTINRRIVGGQNDL
ncbi:hypothetical protein RRG08_045504 [Elysia crispata]|uniref:Uncharacterized protein n=1 Tax=Elysia crispata TaxID=231223 RepID=A0AAE1DYD6_9GAST|nr:hypothetical protein RRG08_045504 [Elysia crispata]